MAKHFEHHIGSFLTSQNTIYISHSFLVQACNMSSDSYCGFDLIVLAARKFEAAPNINTIYRIQTQPLITVVPVERERLC